MPLPIVPFVAGGALLALLGAGKTEKAPGGASTNAPGNVAPTQQSTGGDGGGAQAPSHADVGNGPGTPGVTGADNPGPAVNPAMVESMFGAGAIPSDASVLQGDISSGTGPGYATAGAAATDDPWSPLAGPSVATSGTISPVRAVLGVGAVTAKSAGDAFTELGRSFGAIW